MQTLFRRSLFVIKSKRFLSLNNRKIVTTFAINSRFNSTSGHSLPLVAIKKIIVEQKPIMSSEYVYTNDTPVVQLEVEKAFNGLTEEEKLYAHYLSKACWVGSLIVLFQTSPESPLIFTVFHRILRHQSLEELKKLAQTKAEFDDNDWQSFLVYWSAFLANMGNYRGFGDQKFIPALEKNKLNELVVNTTAFKSEKDLVSIWDNIKDKMFSLEKNELALGFAPEGTTTYFSKNCTEQDSKLVKEFMELNKIDAYNSRVFKVANNTFEIRFPSILSNEEPEESDYLNKLKTQEFKGHKFVLTRGDYSPILKAVNKYLSLAEENASNNTEKMMIGEYIRHFLGGDLDRHKDGSRHWIKDKGPVVETYIGFIENYRDPAGMRAEFEGFVAVVNKEMSKKFSTLVAGAESLLPLLPWSRELEKDKFLKPDFTSLDVLTFGGSGIPAGINIPNYDQIRQNEGFKNVSLGNVITASLKEKKINYLTDEDTELMNKYSGHSFEVQVGLHELLGHGSGKLLNEDENHKLNFDENKTINPLTNQKVDKWYKSGASYDSVFTALASSYEECRAECVGLYLCLEPTVIKIFGHLGAEAEDVVYVNWLDMVHKGIESLKMFNPSVNKWLQAHSQARFAITRVLLESAPNLVEIKYIEKSASDGKPDLLIRVNRDVIRTEGKEAIKQFLLKLQVYKSTADIEAAKQMFYKYSEVTKQFLEYRQIVLDRKKPRKLFVQSSTHLSGDGKSAAIKTYSPTHESLIESFNDHLKDEEGIDEALVDLWRKDCKHFA